MIISDSTPASGQHIAPTYSASTSPGLGFKWPSLSDPPVSRRGRTFERQREYDHRHIKRYTTSMICMDGAWSSHDPSLREDIVLATRLDCLDHREAENQGTTRMDFSDQHCEEEEVEWVLEAFEDEIEAGRTIERDVEEEKRKQKEREERWVEVEEYYGQEEDDEEVVPARETTKEVKEESMEEDGGYPESGVKVKQEPMDEYDAGQGDTHYEMAAQSVGPENLAQYADEHVSVNVSVTRSIKTGNVDTTESYQWSSERQEVVLGEYGATEHAEGEADGLVGYKMNDEKASDERFDDMCETTTHIKTEVVDDW